jgi:hypothetical protein
MGAVDPAVKSRGLFGALFKKTMEKVCEIPMQYCLLDFVTNHEYSQRHVSKYGTCELALFAGCQSQETQARLKRLGLGLDPEGMDRYSLLVSVIPRVPHPFGEETSLPESLGEPYGFLLKPLGLSWSPCPRFEVLPPRGRYQASLQPGQSAVIFDLCEPGREAAEAILEEWRNLMLGGFNYAAIEVPLDVPGIGALYDLVSAHGFFAAGFVPYQLSDRLGFRFQALGPKKVAFEKIKVATEPARRLLKLVRGDYQAFSLLGVAAQGQAIP